jgi:hypothetical protein
MVAMPYVLLLAFGWLVYHTFKKIQQDDARGDDPPPEPPSPPAELAGPQNPS